MNQPTIEPDLVQAALGKITSNLEAMIAAAPGDAILSADEIAAEEDRRRIEDRDYRHRQALGNRTGWPVKYLDAVKSAPHGELWLAAYKIAGDRVRQNGIVVLYGKRGGGKTRMAAELAAMVGSSRYRTAMRFFLEVRSTFKKGAERTEMDVIDELATAELLILDEIQERGETGFEDRLLTHVIDARYAAMKPTILIANLTKSELAESLGASIVDRARENGKSIEFNWPSYRKQP